MIDLTSELNKENIEVLFEGLWDSELPDIIGIKNFSTKLEAVMSCINNKQGVDCYEFSSDGFIESFKLRGKTPSYIHQQGSEAVSYYGFKDNGSWRELQISNLILYLSFIYNTIWVYEDFFREIYMQSCNEEIIKNSNSYLISDDHFLNPDYEGVFLANNSKKTNRHIYAENEKRFLKAEDTYIHSMKMDIESFYPNIYTHYLEKIGSRKPFDSYSDDIRRYFKFLDTYNMKINSNQTKGIPAGVYSSAISSELLMLCVDYDIRENILGESDTAYLRFVDDLNFYSNSKYELEGTVQKVQKILNDYRLRINGFKTETLDCVMTASSTSKYDIYSKLPFMDLREEEAEFTFKLEDFYEMKRYIAGHLENGNIKQVKALLTIFKGNIKARFKERALSFERYEEQEAFKNSIEALFNYLLKLVWSSQKLTYSCYSLIDIIIDIIKEIEMEGTVLIESGELISKLENKTLLIDESYSDTLMQIWHYFVMLKHISKEKKEKLLSDNKGYSPIIIAIFVENSDETSDKVNSKVFNYIKESYENAIEDKSKWKNSIMFSKWWLPLFKIKVIDGYNYQGFMESGDFPEILNNFLDTK